MTADECSELNAKGFDPEEKRPKEPRCRNLEIKPES
jgi:hypothetical protein